MNTREVLQNEWTGFLVEFSNRHQGGHATIEIIGDDIQEQLEGRDLSFVGASAEPLGIENTPGIEASQVVSFMFGEEPDDHMEHRIYGAEHLRTTVGDGIMSDTLEVESSNGTKTILLIKPLSAYS